MKHNNAGERLKRVELHVAHLILKHLYEYGGLKRTQIARKTNMSYDRCVKYLEWLDDVGLIKIETDEKQFELFSLTTLGIGYCKRKILGKDFDKKTKTDNDLLCV